MLIHAHARKKPHTVDLGGRLWVFGLNPAGHFTCDVTDKASAVRLLEIPEGYRPYTGDVPQAEEDEDEGFSPFVLSIGGGEGTEATQTIDLRTLTKAQLVSFATENELEIAQTLKVDEYRKAIVDALNAVE